VTRHVGSGQAGLRYGLCHAFSSYVYCCQYHADVRKTVLFIKCLFPSSTTIYSQKLEDLIWRSPKIDGPMCPYSSATLRQLNDINFRKCQNKTAQAKKNEAHTRFGAFRKLGALGALCCSPVSLMVNPAMLFPISFRPTFL